MGAVRHGAATMKTIVYTQGGVKYTCPLPRLTDCWYSREHNVVVGSVRVIDGEMYTSKAPKGVPSSWIAVDWDGLPIPAHLPTVVWSRWPKLTEEK
jgi:hypothetical protein